jgi:HAD superfamily hydrolase (TIGR01509 family)
MAIEHLIFDCDGVLVDSEPLSMRVDVEILAENGVHISEAEAHARFVGKTFAAMIDDISREFGVSFAENVSAEKDRRLLLLYERELKPVKGVERALQQIGLHGHSVASNSPAERVEAALRITGLDPWFDSRITTFQHVANGKPEPDIFLEAARRADTAPENCLVIEDSVTGVTAAHRAGCTVLGFTGTHPDRHAQAGRLLGVGAREVFAEMAALPHLVSHFLHHARGML